VVFDFDLVTHGNVMEIPVKVILSKSEKRRRHTRMKAMRTLSAVIVTLSLTSCNMFENHDCPDYQRFESIDLPSDYGSSVNKVNDCLAEYGTKLAKGNSSDHDAATAVVNYCGSYEFNDGFSPEDEKADHDKEMNLALRVIVAARAFECPNPRKRLLGKDLSGNTVPIKIFRPLPDSALAATSN
jgi:hypothetical protein